MGQAISFHGHSRFSLLYTLDCKPVHFYMIFLFGICKSDYLVRKLILRKDMKWPLLLWSLWSTLVSRLALTALLETFLSGQCIKTSNLFWVLVVLAAADVGVASLEGRYPWGAVQTGKKLVVINQLLNNSWVFWKTHWSGIVRKGASRLWTFQNAQIVCLLQAYSWLCWQYISCWWLNLWLD